jgi:hypothetical protein
MGFVQIIEFRTSDPEALRKLGEEWEAATEGKRTATKAVFAQDRNDPSRQFNIVFFDSYESAMENSNLPETQAMAEKLMAHMDGQPTFYDLDVIDERL